MNGAPFILMLKGDEHTLILTEHHTVMAKGNNRLGQGGTGSEEDVLTEWTAVLDESGALLTDIETIAATGYNSFALRTFIHGARTKQAIVLFWVMKRKRKSNRITPFRRTPSFAFLHSIENG